MPAGLSRAGRTHHHRRVEPRDVLRANLCICGAVRARLLAVRGVCRTLPGGTAPRRHDDVAEGAPAALRRGRPVKRLLVTIVILGAGIAFYAWYSRTSPDASPDSIAGYAFAILGTLFAILAGVLFARRRRLHKKRVGQLHASLQWHMCFAVIALVFLFLHSFGNFNPRTGTYALYGMIALAVSGFVGKM